MPEDSNTRMYTRSRGGLRRSQGGGSMKAPEASSVSGSPPPASIAGVGGTDRVGVKESEASQIFNKYHREMGVSTHALRAMFRQTKFSDLKNLDKHITSAQLARISSYSKDRRKSFEKRLDLENISAMDEYLLGFAFAVRPIDTLLEFVDLNQGDSDVHTLRNFFAQEDTLEEIDLPDDARLKEIILAYQTILKEEVDLLSGASRDDKTLQIRAIAQHARECFDKIRLLMAENKYRTSAPVENTPNTEAEASSMEPSECSTGPQRITKKTMDEYKREHGTK